MDYDLSKPLFMVGTTASACLTGGMTYISILAIPSFLDAPTNWILLTQWRHLVNVGTRTARILALLSSTCHFCNAYQHWLPPPGASRMDPVAFVRGVFRGGQPGRFVTAGLVTLSVLPFTLIFIKPMNDDLGRRCDTSLNALGVGDSMAADKLSGTGYLTPSGLTPGMLTPATSETDLQAYFAKDKKQKVETTDLIRKWGRWNLVRAILPLAGTLLAFNAL